MLHEFLAQHRDALIERARGRAASRRVPLASAAELETGIPLFLAQLTELLRDRERAHSSGAPLALSDARAHEAMGESADRHGDALHRAGLTVAQVVEGYGDVCQAITDHAVETGASIGVDEYRSLNLCLDVATARAVTAFSARRDRATESGEAERLGVLAHELRNLLSTASLAYQALKRGGVGIDGNTGALLGRSLRALRDAIDRSLSEVRLAATLRNPEHVALAQFVEDLEVGATLDANEKGLVLQVSRVDAGLAVHADRPLLTSAVANLLQNAIKFTPRGGRVSLSVHGDATHVHIEVEDECGGLADGHADQMFRPFDARAAGKGGLGLGLKITRDAVAANGGEIHVRNLPGRGCRFRIELPAV